MSYERLANRLVATQRPILGESAVTVARSVEGLALTEDGTVAEVSGYEPAVLAELTERYIDILGDDAERRLLHVASGFDDLRLPSVLTDREEAVAPDTARPGEDPRSQAASGGGDRSAESPPADRPGENGRAGGRPPQAVSDGGTAAAESPADGPDALRSVNLSEPLKVKYTLASSVTTDDRADLASIYLMPADGDGWQAPVSIADAVDDAVSAATGLDESARRRVLDAIDADRLLATLAGTNGKTVSFVAHGITVTFHRTGSLAVH